MILLDKMKNMKIYRTNTFLPTVDGNKKKGSTIIMLTPNYETSKFLMNHPLFVNQKRFESYYIDRDISFLIGNKKIEEVEESYIFNEMKRSELPDSEFGIPEDRKFPLDSAKHVNSAIRLFGHADDSKKSKLAKRIARKAKEYGIEIPETTQVYRYLHEETILEDSADITDSERLMYKLLGFVESENDTEAILAKKNMIHENMKDVFKDISLPNTIIESSEIFNETDTVEEKISKASDMILEMINCNNDEFIIET